MKKFTLLFILSFWATAFYGQGFTEDFENGGPAPVLTTEGASGIWALQSGNWTVVNKKGAAQTWRFSTVVPAYQGSNAVFIEKESTGEAGATSEDWLISMPFTVPVRPQLRFWCRRLPGTETTTKIMMGTDPTDLNTFTEIGSFTGSDLYAGPNYSEAIVDLPADAANTQKYIAFVNYNAANGHWWAIDNISVDSGLLPCNVASGPLLISNVGINSFDVSWDNPDNITQWEMEVVATSWGHDAGPNTIIVNQPSVAVTATTIGQNLLPYTHYRVGIRAICSNGVKGMWSFKESTTHHIGDTCDTPIELSVSTLPFIGTSYVFRNNNHYAVNNITSGCGANSNGTFTGLQNVHSFTAPTTEDIDISVIGETPGMSVYVYDSCSAIGLNCMGGAVNILPYTNTVHNISVIAGHTYYVITQYNLTPEEDQPYRYPVRYYNLSIVRSNSCTNSIKSGFGKNCGYGSYYVRAYIEDTGSDDSITAKIFTHDQLLSTQNITVPGAIEFGPFNGSYNSDFITIVLQDSKNPDCIIVSPVFYLKQCNTACPTAPVVNVNEIGNCSYTSGSLISGSISDILLSCGTLPVAESWYQFTATSSTQRLEINGLNGGATNLKFALYGGTCPNITQRYCSTESQGTVSGLTVGQVYYVRVYATSFSDSFNYQLCVTEKYPTCADENKLASTVKGLFTNLINHLRNNSAAISASAAIPYVCTELTALAPYISDTNPKIYNFTATPTTLSFNFSNHSTQSFDVVAVLNSPGPLSTIEFTGPYVLTDVSNVTYIQSNASANYSTGSSPSGHVRHINFCPDEPADCNPAITGIIDIPATLSCVVVGQPTAFNFVTNTTGLKNFSWTVYKYDQTIVSTSTTAAPSKTITFTEPGAYYVDLVVTNPSGCKATFKIVVNVQQTACTGADVSCTENNARTSDVKRKFIALVNHLMDLYPSSPVSLPYSCPELTDLAQYLNDPDPKIYNIVFDSGTNQLHFTLGNHAGFDVVIKDMGVAVADVDLFGFTSSENAFTANVVYVNGMASTGNTINHIKFCAGHCPDFDASILLPDATSCITQGTRNISYITSAPAVATVEWQVFIAGSTTALTTQTTPVLNYLFNTIGSYTIKLKITYAGSCARIFEKAMTVVASGQCSSACNSAPSIMVNAIGDCHYTAGSFTGGSLSTVPLTNCLPAPVADMWYKFTATATTEYFKITGLSDVDTGLRFALYSGTCNNLTQIYCSNTSRAEVNNLVPGETYSLRIYATTVLIPLEFNVCITASSFQGCLDSNNPQVAVVKDLFVNLANHLITNKSSIASLGTAYNCTELIALKPYITDADPKIYNFTVSGNNIYFNFSNHGTEIYDVALVRASDGLISGLVSTVLVDARIGGHAAGFVFLQGNSQISDGYFDAQQQGHIRHINFCPKVPCETAIAGTIDINPGLSCILKDQAAVFSFVSDTPDISNWSWVFYDFNGNVLHTATTPQATKDFKVSDSYYMELTVTTTSGCKEKFIKTFYVSDECTSSCTETDSQSVTVKNLYIALLNKLLALYPLNPVSQPYNCEELTALAPYLSVSNPQLYNINYNATTNMLSFAFGNHSGYDVSVRDNGSLISDITLDTFSDSETQFVSAIVYKNQMIYDSSIKHVKFCSDNPSGSCPEIALDILLDGAASCITQGVKQRFYFFTAATNITTYNWTFLAADNVTPLFSISDQSHPEYSYANAGNYNIRLVVNYNNGCTKTFYKNITVSGPGQAPCPSYCTDSNSISTEVKQNYIAFLNKILVMHYSGAIPQNAVGFSQLTTLAPYLLDAQPAIYNYLYDSATNTIKLSFAQHNSSFDVLLPVPSQLYTYVSDINLLPYNNANESLQNLTIIFSNGTTSGLHQVRHVNFCPEVDCVQYPGSIVLQNGISCVPAGQSVSFNFFGDTAHVDKYYWSFYDQSGHPDGFSDQAVAGKTYGQAGNYKIVLTITLDNGCKSTYTKTITVSSGNGCAEQCTETNELSESVRGGFISLVNRLFRHEGAIESPFLSDEVDDLIPFISHSNPRVYNAVYSGQTLSFSFTADEAQPDVVIKNYGLVTDVNLIGYSTDGSYTNILIGYSDGTSEYAKVKHINFCPPEPPCKKHIAFVIDESSSISADEARNIRLQLSNFVRQQKEMNTGTYISFIGMSDSDANTRHDHVYKIPATDGDILAFDTWLSKYRNTPARENTGISGNSDYWSSGLLAAMNMDIRPELVIVIADGSEATNILNLKNIIRDVRQNSHLYVYGTGTGSYVDLDPLYPDPNTHISEVTAKLMSSLKYLFELPATQFPVSDQNHLDTGDYFEYTDFNHLGADLRYFSDKISASGFGCGGYTVPKSYCSDCETFQPTAGNYFISGWIKELQNIQVKQYNNAVVKLYYEDSEGNETSNPLLINASGDIIDGWQRFASGFSIPLHTAVLRIELLNLSPNIPVFFDDIRVHPVNGSMKSFVYDPETFKLMAELDDNNYSTFYEYDKEGSLIRVKKETSKGIKTIQESRSGNVIQPVQN